LIGFSKNPLTLWRRAG